MHVHFKSGHVDKMHCPRSRSKKLMVYGTHPYVNNEI